MDLGLEGKVAIVTGAGSAKGFGRGIARVLAQEGCFVVCADIDLPGAKDAAFQIEKMGGKALGVFVDVTNKDSVEQMVAMVLDALGKIDILVNNAGGIVSLKSFIEKPEEEWLNEIKLNFIGVLYCVRSVLPHMISRKYGKIINITSIGAGRALPHAPIYNAAKAAVVNFTKTLGVTLAPLGINVNSIAPGFGLTGFGGGKVPADVNKILERIPDKRPTLPEDIGNLVAFLASDISKHIIGQNIGVDGGESAL